MPEGTRLNVPEGRLDVAEGTRLDVAEGTRLGVAEGTRLDVAEGRVWTWPKNRIPSPRQTFGGSIAASPNGHLFHHRDPERSLVPPPRARTVGDSIAASPNVR